MALLQSAEGALWGVVYKYGTPTERPEHRVGVFRSNWVVLFKSQFNRCQFNRRNLTCRNLTGPI